MKRIARAGAILSTMALLCVALAVCIEIFVRSAFRYSFIGVNDLSGLLVAVAVSAAFPIVVTNKSDLVIELLEQRMGADISRALRYIGGWLTFAALLLLCWRIGVTAAEFTASGASTEVVKLPIAPFLWVVTGFIGFAALAQLCLSVGDLGGKPFAGLFFASKFRAVFYLGLAVATLALIALSIAFGDSVKASLRLNNPLVVAGLMFLVMWLAALLVFPLGAVMLLCGVGGLALSLGTMPALNGVATRSIELLSSELLLTIPLFLMMGSFAQTAGLSTDMYRLAHAALGHMRGGLALATVGACAGFGSMTGSSMATSLTVGQAAYPEMRQLGYSPELSTGSIAAGGTLGQIVPPSTVLILYAVLTETSIGDLFIAAAIPAAIIIFTFVVAVMAYVRIYPQSAPAPQPHVRGSLRAALLSIWPSLGLIIFVLGGIYSGLFTVTEAASVGAVGALVLAGLRGKLSMAVFRDLLIETADRTAMIYALIVGGSIFAFFVGVTQLPVVATQAITQLALPGILVIALALFIYILLGMIMDSYAILIITVPVIAPVIVGFGYDLIWWGIVMQMIVEVGLLSPPFGMNCFILKAIAPDVPLTTVFRGVTPFILADLVALVILVSFPILTLWLPAALK